MQTLQLAHIVSTLLLLSYFTAAWPWPSTLESIEGLIMRRDDSNSTSAALGSQSTDASKSASTKTDTATSSATAAATTGGSQSTSASQDSKASKNATSTKSSATISIDPRLPAGGINMITPSAVAAASFYKVGDFVTFAWNYTSLSITPTAVDVLASCSANSATYTISSNMSVAPTGAVTWDTNLDATGSAPLLTETYTLVIHDAAKDVSATAAAGRLGTFDQFTFGMYTPQPYTPLSGYICVTCSGALSDMERQTLKFLFGMSTLTILSFTWFAGGFGAFA